LLAMICMRVCWALRPVLATCMELVDIRYLLRGINTIPN
jgi:hypothetical protein